MRVILAIFITMEKKLEVFIDESGNLSFNKRGSAFYILSFVAIDENVNKAKYFSKLRCDHFHAAPIIRTKDEYTGVDIIGRKRMFMSMNMLATTIGIKSKSFVIAKKDFKDEKAFVKCVNRELYQFVENSRNLFEKYDDIEFFYDDGQHEITKILEVVICAINTSTNLNIIKSNKPRMFEVADYISELALLERKCKDGLLNRSELAFFDKKELRNKYLKPYLKKIKI